MTKISQDPQLPRTLRPIVLIGAGGIVKNAHLPAYRIAGFEVVSLYDIDPAKARELAAEFKIPAVHETLAETISAAPADAIFDLAVPASALPEVLAVLPDGAGVLIQKPFGEDLPQARELLALCQKKGLRASVNFQLRYSPCVIAARQLIEAGEIGEVHDVEVRVTVHMPWHLWTFLEGLPRVEMLYHSVHYIDLVRSFLGEPQGIYAKTVKHPRTLRLASTRTNIAFDYGDMLRANITTNHGHDYRHDHAESYVKWEGTRGAIKAHLGLLLNYLRGEPDALEICKVDDREIPGEWQSIPLEGNWYPHAFIGTMSALMRYVNGETDELPTRVEDAFKTMAVLEAAYESNAHGATPIPQT